MTIIDKTKTSDIEIDGNNLIEKMSEKKNKGIIPNLSQFKNQLKESIKKTQDETKEKQLQLRELEEARIKQKEEDLNNDIFHQEVLKNTTGIPAKTFVPYFEAFVEYQYEKPNLKEGKPDTITRAFSIEFINNNDTSEYLCMIRKKKLCKEDLLNLYNAFRLSIKEKMDSLFENYHKNEEKRKEDKEVQMQLFSNDFREANIIEIPFSLFIFSKIEQDFIKIKFSVIKSYQGYALKLNREQYITCQDIHYIYSNFEQIINKSLNKEIIQDKKEVA